VPAWNERCIESLQSEIEKAKSLVLHVCGWAIFGTLKLSRILLNRAKYLDTWKTWYWENDYAAEAARVLAENPVL
jgi:hypothetical protein